ncbi:MAG: hypothetical protein AAF616_14270, partial [Bacteroidota bacterium]
DGEAPQTVQLSSLQDGFEANTDEQDLSVSGGNLNISGGSGVSLASLQDGTGTDDQTVDLLELSGTQLRLSLEGDGEAPQTVQLSSLQDGTGTDDQTIDQFQLNGANVLSLSLESDGEAAQTVDLSSLDQDISFSSDPVRINLTGGSFIDVSNWDLDNSDDFFLPATESFNTGANILDLTNSGSGITAVFDRTSSTNNPTLRAFSGGSGSVAQFDHGNTADGDIIVEFRNEGTNVATVRDDGRIRARSLDINKIANDNTPVIQIRDDALGGAAIDANTGIIIGNLGLNTQGGIRFNGSAFQGNVDGTLDGWVNLSGAGSPWNQSGGNLNYTTGRVGIGTTTPDNVLSIKGVAAPSANANEGVFLDIHNDAGLQGYQAGIRFKVNAVDANQRFNAAIFNRLNTSNAQELNFAIQSNDPENVGANDIKMTISQSGNVGIGTSNPSNKLTIQNNTASSTAPLISIQDQTGSGDAAINFDSQGGGNFTIGLDDSDNQFKIGSGSSLGVTNLMTANSAGRFIFGTGSTSIGAANFLFNQNTSGFGGMYVNTNSGGQPFYGYAAGGGALAFHYIDGSDGNKWKLFNGAVRMTVRPDNGNIGIGTVDPSARLDIVGNLEVNGRIDNPPSVNGSTSTTLVTPIRKVVRITTNVNRTIRRINPGVDGQEVIIINANNFDITFRNRVTGVGEVATDNLLMDGGNNVTLLSAGATIHFIYDSVLERWVQVSISNNVQPVIIF